MKVRLAKTRRKTNSEELFFISLIAIPIRDVMDLVVSKEENERKTIFAMREKAKLLRAKALLQAFTSPNYQRTARCITKPSLLC